VSNENYAERANRSKRHACDHQRIRPSPRHRSRPGEVIPSSAHRLAMRLPFGSTTVYPLIERTCWRVIPPPLFPSCTSQSLPSTCDTSTNTWPGLAAAIPDRGEVRGNFRSQLAARFKYGSILPNRYMDASQPQNLRGHPAGRWPITPCPLTLAVRFLRVLDGLPAAPHVCL
jgi:hypothetical protein